MVMWSGEVQVSVRLMSCERQISIWAWHWWMWNLFSSPTNIHHTGGCQSWSEGSGHVILNNEASSKSDAENIKHMIAGFLWNNHTWAGGGWLSAWPGTSYRGQVSRGQPCSASSQQPAHPGDPQYCESKSLANLGNVILEGVEHISLSFFLKFNPTF